MKKILSILLVPFICFILAGNVSAAGDAASVSLDLPVSNQSFKPGEIVQISGRAQNINQVTILVRNAGGAIAYATQPSVTNGTFSTQFQLNNDAAEGQYTIRIGAKELVAPVDFTFMVSNEESNAGILEVWPAATGYELHLRGTGEGSVEKYYGKVYQGESAYTGSSSEVLVEFNKRPYLDSYEYVSQPIVTEPFPIGQYDLKFYTDSNRTILAFNYSFKIDPMIHITNPPLHGTSTTNQINITGYISNFSSLTVSSLQYKLNTGDWQNIMSSLNESGNFSIPVTLQSGNNSFQFQMQYTSAQTTSTIHNIVGDISYNLDECFIATACFGSKYEPSVVLLREFRDDYLMKTNWGKAFVSYYYQNSPPIAAYIANSSELKGLTRIVLLPFISIVYLLYHPFLTTGVLLLALTFVMYNRRRKIFV